MRAQNNDMREVAEGDADVRPHAASAFEDQTISVEQMRERFRAEGFDKSKDTVQRGGRKGDLTCQKRVVMGLYFTTDASLLALEKKLMPDMITENAEDASHDMQVYGVDEDTERAEMQPHAGEDAAERSAHTGRPTQ